MTFQPEHLHPFISEQNVSSTNVIQIREIFRAANKDLCFYTHTAVEIKGHVDRNGRWRSFADVATSPETFIFLLDLLAKVPQTTSKNYVQVGLSVIKDHSYA
jgi:hypothetical protein